MRTSPTRCCALVLVTIHSSPSAITCVTLRSFWFQLFETLCPRQRVLVVMLWSSSLLLACVADFGRTSRLTASGRRVEFASLLPFVGPVVLGDASAAAARGQGADDSWQRSWQGWGHGWARDAGWDYSTEWPGGVGHRRAASSSRGAVLARGVTRRPTARSAAPRARAKWVPKRVAGAEVAEAPIAAGASAEEVVGDAGAQKDSAVVDQLWRDYRPRAQDGPDQADAGWSFSPGGAGWEGHRWSGARWGAARPVDTDAEPQHLPVKVMMADGGGDCGGDCGGGWGPAAAAGPALERSASAGSGVAAHRGGSARRWGSGSRGRAEQRQQSGVSYYPAASRRGPAARAAAPAGGGEGGEGSSQLPSIIPMGRYGDAWNTRECGKWSYLWRVTGNNYRGQLALLDQLPQNISSHPAAAALEKDIKASLIEWSYSETSVMCKKGRFVHEKRDLYTITALVGTHRPRAQPDLDSKSSRRKRERSLKAPSHLQDIADEMQDQGNMEIATATAIFYWPEDAWSLAKVVSAAFNQDPLDWKDLPAPITMHQLWEIESQETINNMFADWVTPMEELLHFLSAEIPSAEANASSDRWNLVPQPVTQYRVRLTAVGRREVWTVYRRYSKFYTLWQNLQKRFPEHVLPPIPRKKLLGKEYPQFIEQRRVELEEFLGLLLKLPVEISLSEEVCLFLEVPEPLRREFLDADSWSAPAPSCALLLGDGQSCSHGGSDRGGGSAGGAGGVDDARCCERSAALRARLQGLPSSRMVSVRGFEEWLLTTCRTRDPPMTQGHAELIFLGPEGRGGLLEVVGELEKSEVRSIAALGLLCKLLSHESCGEATLFRAVLRRLDFALLSRMRLQHHIHRNRGQSNRLDAFHVLRSLELPANALSALLQDDFALREFRRWSEGLQGTLSFRTLHRPLLAHRRAASVETPGLQARGELSSRECRKISNSAVTNVQMYLSLPLPSGELELPHRAAAECEGAAAADLDSEVPPAPADLGISLGAARSFRLQQLQTSSYALEGYSEQGPQWCAVPCPEPLWREHYGVRAFYRYVEPSEHQLDTYMVRVELRLPWPPLLVACLLADHGSLIDHLLPSAPELSPATAERLRQIAEGSLPLLSQLQSSRTAKQLSSGAASEVYSEHLECTIGTPAAPHASVRLWLLKFLRITRIPDDMGSPSMATGSCRGGGMEGSIFRGEGISSYLFVCTAAPPVADTPASWQEAPDGARAGPREEFCRQASRSSLDEVLTRTRASLASPRGKRGAPERVAHLRPSGVEVRPAAGGAGEGSEVSVCLLPGKETIRLVSGDLLGERLILWKTLGNALFVLESLCPAVAGSGGGPPLPSGFTHPLLARLEQCLARPARAYSPSGGSAASRTSSAAAEAGGHSKPASAAREGGRGWPP
ncbi:unnamed protein product [Prorocentrum cordatum]|uniref:PX domain-containing protein n=1 Tax=Prorocentrum cordatum TaxID=2364126 RepID=A0ABN9TAR0_9DINO|nr:unnamed protein product [Polarella glacialis]